MQHSSPYVKALRAGQGEFVSGTQIIHAASMPVEFIPAAHVRAVTARIHAARQRAADHCGPAPAQADARYWERFFETNAADVLGVLPAVELAPGYVVRYRFFGERGRDLLVRPFVARRDTDVDPIRRLLDWHPAPDSIASVLTDYPTQDVEFLYPHFSHPATAVGTFEYWLAMQEVWASQRWIHSHLIASAEELSQITAAEGWQLVQPVTACEPAVVLSDATARLAVLLHCPLGRFQITLQQVEIGADQSLRFVEPVLVAAGPRGYLL
jgi:hypothetical protein